MACGLPVVAAKATGSQSLVKHNDSGKLITPGAIRGFADALQVYCENHDVRKAHGLAGEKRAEEFSWDQINNAVAQTYMRLVRQRRAGHGPIKQVAVR
jgi:glycosyltransferase involved in cell wall biosynthesis